MKEKKKEEKEIKSNKNRNTVKEGQKSLSETTCILNFIYPNSKMAATKYLPKKIS